MVLPCRETHSARYYKSRMAEYRFVVADYPIIVRHFLQNTQTSYFISSAHVWRNIVRGQTSPGILTLDNHHLLGMNEYSKYPQSGYFGFRTNFECRIRVVISFFWLVVEILSYDKLSPNNHRSKHTKWLSAPRYAHHLPAARDKKFSKWPAN